MNGAIAASISEEIMARPPANRTIHGSLAAELGSALENPWQPVTTGRTGLASRRRLKPQETMGFSWLRPVGGLRWWRWQPALAHGEPWILRRRVAQVASPSFPVGGSPTRLGPSHALA